MTNFISYPQVYPNIPTAPLESMVNMESQDSYHLGIIQSKRQGLLKLEENYKRKHKKYTKILDRLIWLNACSNGISVISGISSVATLSTFIGLPVGIPLGGISLAGASFSGITTVITKKYQKKLLKIQKLSDIIIAALAVFETSVSKALNDNKIEKQEFNVLQKIHIETLNKLSNIDRKMEAENRNQIEKSLVENMNDIRRSLMEKIEKIEKKTTTKNL